VQRVGAGPGWREEATRACPGRSRDRDRRGDAPKNTGAAAAAVCIDARVCVCSLDWIGGISYIVFRKLATPFNGYLPSGPRLYDGFSAVTLKAGMTTAGESESALSLSCLWNDFYLRAVPHAACRRCGGGTPSAPTPVERAPTLRWCEVHIAQDGPPRPLRRWRRGGVAYRRNNGHAEACGGASLLTDRPLRLSRTPRAPFLGNTRSWP
jgi:hypothetical protein